MMDGLKDQRNLSRIECIFQKILKRHLSKLLQVKREYWKQRATIRWVRFGNENTKNFQAMATIKHRANKISQLTLEDGTVISEHDLKFNALWVSFKKRLGINEYQDMLFNLQELIQACDLPEMDMNFTDEEIKCALKDMPTDHAPRLDGFNGKFMKNC